MHSILKSLELQTPCALFLPLMLSIAFFKHKCQTKKAIVETRKSKNSIENFEAWNSFSYIIKLNFKWQLRWIVKISLHCRLTSETDLILLPPSRKVKKDTPLLKYFLWIYLKLAKFKIAPLKKTFCTKDYDYLLIYFRDQFSNWSNKS